MSDELTKKLKIYLLAAYTGGIIYKKASAAWEADVSDKLISGITKAFVEDGYTKIDVRPYRDEKGNKYRQYTFNNGFVRVPTFELMTGQEWFDRFSDKLYDLPSVGWGAPTEQSQKDWGKNHAALWIPQEDAIQAARRAAGIEENKK